MRKTTDRADRADRARVTLFGFEHHRVAPDDPASDVHARIASVDRLIAREAWRFASSLPPRRRAQYDVDDLTQEAWAVLLERDHQFKPERYAPEKGGYLGFARLVLRQHFTRTVLRSHAVHIPRKHSEPSSGIADNREAMAAFRRGRKPPRPIREGSVVAGGEPVVDEAGRREAACLAHEAVRLALDGMADRRNAAMLRRHYGALGEPERPARGFHFRRLHAAEAEARELLAGVAVAV